MEKTCSTCKVTKNVSEFYKNSKRKDGFASGCKKCVDVASARWRSENQCRHYNRKSDRHAKNKLLVEQYKRERGCIVCGENTPVCLDLHHLDPAQKEAHPSQFIGVSYKRWLGEAEKCVVICSNCHRKVHAGIITLDIGELG